MIGSRACLAFTLLCLVYFVAHFEKYSLLPSVKVNWTEGTRLPAITWGDESRANDFPDDKPPGSFNKQPFHSDSAIGPDTDGSHLDLSELEGNDSDQNWDGKEDADDADDADDEMYTSVSLSLHGWLMKRGLMPGKSIPIVTIADSSYLHVLHAMQQRLGKWGYDRDLVVLCLDQACAEDTELLNPYPGYLLENDAAMHAVAFFKVFSLRILNNDLEYDRYS